MLKAIALWLKERRELREFSKAHRRFLNRKRYKVLDPSILARIPDEDLGEAVVDCAMDLMFENGSGDLQVLASFSPGLRFAYASWRVVGEVNNGGFGQYFLNCEDSMVDIAIEGFRYFGALDLAELTEQALLVWKEKVKVREASIKSPEMDARLDEIEEQFENRFNALTDQFYESPTDIHALLCAKIRSNPEDFSTGTPSASPVLMHRRDFHPQSTESPFFLRSEVRHKLFESIIVATESAVSFVSSQIQRCIRMLTLRTPLPTIQTFCLGLSGTRNLYAFICDGPKGEQNADRLYSKMIADLTEHLHLKAQQPIPDLQLDFWEELDFEEGRVLVHRSSNRNGITIMTPDGDDILKMILKKICADSKYRLSYTRLRDDEPTSFITDWNLMICLFWGKR